jgi:hypothetical protein
MDACRTAACSRPQHRPPAQAHPPRTTSSRLPDGMLRRRKGVSRSTGFLFRCSCAAATSSGGRHLAAASASTPRSVAIGPTLTTAFWSGGPR